MHAGNSHTRERTLADRVTKRRCHCVHVVRLTEAMLTGQHRHGGRPRRGLPRHAAAAAVSAASGIGDLERFAVKLRNDLAAVQAGLTLRHSNGQTEGQVTKLKLVKRQGYGRAKVDLLRKRLLRAA